MSDRDITLADLMRVLQSKSAPSEAANLELHNDGSGSWGIESSTMRDHYFACLNGLRGQVRDLLQELDEKEAVKQCQASKYRLFAAACKYCDQWDGKEIAGNKAWCELMNSRRALLSEKPE